MTVANWIYQFSLLSFVLEMISVPYSASVISHEKMGAFAFVTIAKVFLTFGIALSLAASPIDKLVFYTLEYLVFMIPPSDSQLSFPAKRDTRIAIHFPGRFLSKIFHSYILI